MNGMPPKTTIMVLMKKVLPMMTMNAMQPIAAITPIMSGMLPGMTPTVGKVDEAIPQRG